jgi:hypothetical protein
MDMVDGGFWSVLVVVVVLLEVVLAVLMVHIDRCVVNNMLR